MAKYYVGRITGFIYVSPEPGFTENITKYWWDVGQTGVLSEKALECWMPYLTLCRDIPGYVVNYYQMENFLAMNDQV